jgi:predicted nucleic acid-binding protein
VTGFLLDTNVVSELTKKHPDARVRAWIESTDEHLLHLSVLTLGELRKGIDLLPDQRRRETLESWLSRDLTLRFAGRILPIDQVVAERWGQISAGDAARKSPLPVIDALLAATALCHELTLATRNIRDIARSGALVFDPWQP